MSLPNSEINMTVPELLKLLPSKLVISIVGLDKIDHRTIEERNSNPTTAPWLGNTQLWSWEGGDAIVVTTGYHPNVRTYAVIRIRNSVFVRELRGGIAGFFGSFDIQTKVQGGSP